MENEVHYRYWPKDKEIPEGWELMNDMKLCHHGIWSIMIKKVNMGNGEA